MTKLNKAKQKIVKKAAQESVQASKMRKNRSHDGRDGEPENPIDLIAEISEAILEAPDAAFKSNAEEEPGSEGRVKKTPSRMRQLLAFASQKQNASVSQLAILSLLAVFKDILPSYRIRLPSTKELAVRVSKETKKL